MPDKRPSRESRDKTHTPTPAGQRTGREGPRPAPEAFADKRPAARVQRAMQMLADRQTRAQRPAATPSPLAPLLKKEAPPEPEEQAGADMERPLSSPAGAIPAPPPPPFRPPASPAGPVVQAKMGFEIELNGAPVYGDPPAGRLPQFLKTDQPLTPKEAGDIKKYLGGGLEYGVNYGTEQDGLFDLSADHDGPSSNPHHALMNALADEGYIDPMLPYAAMSNIEYRTAPIEERDPGATALVARIAQAMQQHMVDTANKAQQRNGAYTLNAPALSLYTGIPKVALLRLTSNSRSPELTDAIDTAADVTPKASFQTTTGVLPSEIPALFAEALQKYQVGTQNKFGPQAGQFPPIAAMLDVFTQSELIAESVLGGANFLPQNLAGGDRNALKGWLMLITQYLFGHYLEQTQFNISTPKNLVLYFSKTDMHRTIAALPPAVRPPTDPQNINWPNWYNLLTQLHTEVVHYDIVTQTGLDDQPTDSAIIVDPDTWIRAILSGGPTPGEKSSNPLGLDIQTNTPASGLRTQEEAIPLEERQMENRMTDPERQPGNIANVINTEWQQAVTRRQASTQAPGNAPANRPATPLEQFLLTRAAARRWIDKAHRMTIDVAAFEQTYNQNHGQTGEQALAQVQDLSPNTTQLEALLRQVIAAVNQHQQGLNQQTPPKEMMNVAGGVEMEYTDDNNYEPQLYFENGDHYALFRGDLFKVTERNQNYGFEDNDNVWHELKRKHQGQIQVLKGLPDTWQ